MSLPGLAAAVVLLLSLFLPWFSLQFEGREETWNAWQVFSKIDSGIALAALAAAALSFTRSWTTALMRWAIGGLTLLVVAWKAVEAPAYEQASPLIGPYVAIAAAGAIVAAAIVELRRSTVPAPLRRAAAAPAPLARVAAFRPHRAVVALAVVAGLTALAAAAYGTWIRDGGLDQVGYPHAAWIHNDSDGSWGGAIGALSHLDYRPGARPYIGALHVVFGTQPGGHVAWAILLVLVSSILLYAVLRRIQLPAAYALLAAAVLLMFPATDSTRFGTTLSIASWSIALWLGGLLIALRGISTGGRAGAAWHGLALAFYFLSVITYEIAAGAIGLSVLAYALFARSWRPALYRWPADVAVVALPVVFIVLKNTRQSTQSADGAVAHAHQIWDESWTLMGGSLWPSDHVNGTTVAIVALLIVLTGALAAVLLPRADAVRRALSRSLLLGVGGLLLLGAGYAPFVPADRYYSPLQIGDGNRTNALAAAGYSLAIVCVLSVASLLACAPLRRPWVSIAVAWVAGCVLLAGPYADRLQLTTGFRVHAYELQQHLSATVARDVPKARGAWTVYAFGVPAFTGPGVPVFNTIWDMPGAVGLARGNNDVTAYPIAATDVRCEPSRAFMVRYGVGTTYGARLLFVDAANGGRVVVDSAARCHAALRRMPSGPFFAVD